jgi:hypothetical protein
MGLKQAASSKAARRPGSKQPGAKRPKSFVIFIKNSLYSFPSKGDIETKN